MEERISEAGKRLIASANDALDLVKRLRDPWPEYDYRSDAADMIEQLERELADERELCDRLAREAGNVDYMERPHCLDRAITDHRIRRGGK